MKNFFGLIWIDLKRLFSYRIIHFIAVLTFFFVMTMILWTGFAPVNFLYVSIFILPVIIFSVSMFIEREENTFLPLLSSSKSTLKFVMAKILSAVSVEIIPFIGFIIVMLVNGRDFQTDYHINYFTLLLVYLMGVVVHIIIGLSLSIIAKSSRFLSLSYLVYIIVFSLLPILYSNGIIPESLQYFLIISPAFLSGVLVDYIVAEAINPQVWLIVLSVGLQIVYAFVLVFFVIMPFFKPYLLSTEDKILK